MKRTVEIPTRVTYKDGDRTISVERLSESDLTESVAHGALALLHQAYAKVFEEDASYVPDGTVRRHFYPDTSDQRAQSVQRQLQRMRAYTQNGSQYWIVRDPDIGVSDTFIALGKASPSRALPLRRPNLYVNDIVVAPPHWRQRYGSVMLETLAKYGGFDPNAKAVLDAQANNHPGRAFFKQAGFTPDFRIPVDDFVFLEGDPEHEQRLPMLRHEAGRIAVVIGNLEEETPWLISGVPEFENQ